MRNLNTAWKTQKSPGTSASVKQMWLQQMPKVHTLIHNMQRCWQYVPYHSTLHYIRKVKTIYSGLSKSNFKDHYGDLVITHCLGKIAKINDLSHSGVRSMVRHMWMWFNIHCSVTKMYSDYYHNNRISLTWHHLKLPPCCKLSSVIISRPSADNLKPWATGFRLPKALSGFVAAFATHPPQFITDAMYRNCIHRSLNTIKLSCYE